MGGTPSKANVDDEFDPLVDVPVVEWTAPPASSNKYQLLFQDFSAEAAPSDFDVRLPAPRKIFLSGSLTPKDPPRINTIDPISLLGGGHSDVASPVSSFHLEEYLLKTYPMNVYPVGVDVVAMSRPSNPFGLDFYVVKSSRPVMPGFLENETNPTSASTGLVPIFRLGDARSQSPATLIRLPRQEQAASIQQSGDEELMFHFAKADHVNLALWRLTKKKQGGWTKGKELHVFRRPQFNEANAEWVSSHSSSSCLNLSSLCYAPSVDLNALFVSQEPYFRFQSQNREEPIGILRVDLRRGTIKQTGFCENDVIGLLELPKLGSLAAVSSRGTVSVWDSREGAVGRGFELPPREALIRSKLAVQCLPETNLIVLGLDEGKVAIVDLRMGGSTADAVRVLQVHENEGVEDRSVRSVDRIGTSIFVSLAKVTETKSEIVSWDVNQLKVLERVQMEADLNDIRMIPEYGALVEDEDVLVNQAVGEDFAPSLGAKEETPVLSSPFPIVAEVPRTLYCVLSLGSNCANPYLGSLDSSTLLQSSPGSKKSVRPKHFVNTTNSRHRYVFSLAPDLLAVSLASGYVDVFETKSVQTFRGVNFKEYERSIYLPHVNEIMLRLATFRTDDTWPVNSLTRLPMHAACSHDPRTVVFATASHKNLEVWKVFDKQEEVDILDSRLLPYASERIHSFEFPEDLMHGDVERIACLCHDAQWDPDALYVARQMSGNFIDSQMGILRCDLHQGSVSSTSFTPSGDLFAEDDTCFGLVSLGEECRGLAMVSCKGIVSLWDCRSRTNPKTTRLRVPVDCDFRRLGTLQLFSAPDLSLLVVGLAGGKVGMLDVRKLGGPSPLLRTAQVHYRNQKMPENPRPFSGLDRVGQYEFVSAVGMSEVVSWNVSGKILTETKMACYVGGLAMVPSYGDLGTDPMGGECPIEEEEDGEDGNAEVTPVDVLPEPLLSKLLEERQVIVESRLEARDVPQDVSLSQKSVLLAGKFPDEEPRLRFVNAETFEPVPDLSIPLDEDPRGLLLLPSDSDHVALFPVSGQPSNISIYSMSTKSIIAKCEGHEREITNLVHVGRTDEPDRIASGDSRGCVIVFDSTTGEDLMTFPSLSGSFPVRSLLYAPSISPRSLFVCCQGIVRCDLETADASEIFPSELNTDFRGRYVAPLLSLGDRKLLFSVDVVDSRSVIPNGFFRLYSVADGEKVSELKVYHRMLHAQYLEEFNVIVIASDRGTVRFVDPRKITHLGIKCHQVHYLETGYGSLCQSWAKITAMTRVSEELFVSISGDTLEPTMKNEISLWNCRTGKVLRRESFDAYAYGLGTIPLYDNGLDYGVVECFEEEEG